MTEQSNPPAAPQRPHRREFHGEVLHDPWFWLKDPGYPQVSDQQVLGYLEAENRWFEAGMAPLQPLVATLFEELKGRVTPDESSVPVREGAHDYWWAFEPGAQYRQWWRRPVAGGADELILSEPALAKGKAYFRLAGISASPDGRLLAYGFDDNGSERFTLRVRDLATGADVATVATTSIGVPVWTADSTALAWTEVNEHWRSFRVALHRLGMAEDITLYEESDPGFSVGVGKSQDGRWLIIAAGDKVTSEVRLLSAEDPRGVPLLVRSRSAGLEYDVDVRGDMLFVRANDTHPNFRVATAHVETPAAWTTVIEGSDAHYIRGISAFAAYLAVSGRDAGLDQVWLHFDDGRTETITFPEASYSARIGDNREASAPLLRLGYSSMVTPSSVFDYEVGTGALHIRKVQQVASGYDANLYATERLMIPVRDGVLVPVSVVYRKDWGRQRLHLYGYGAYGIAIPPGFSASRLSLLDRGLAYAIAHVRGGDDLGHQWYLDGKLEKRTNAFNDFIDVARGLVDLGYAVSGQISASGGSAGGELMGVVINDAPELWRAVVADVPFVDVLNTMLDDSLPLTPGEWPEWGNPIIDKAAFELIRSYSPYDQVRPQAYPPLLVTAGLNDPRVTYWEPAKWVAKLRVYKTDANPLYLKTNMGAGHGGKSGRFAALEETAEEFAFILNAFGVTG